MQATQPTTTVRPDTAREASAAVQYQNQPAVALRNADPGVVAAAGRAISTYYNSSPREVAANLAITRREPLSWADAYGNQPLTVLHTASGSASSADLTRAGFILYDRRPSGMANGGRVWVHIPDRGTDPANLPTFGLKVGA
jgi:hypothetical protein